MTLSRRRFIQNGLISAAGLALPGAMPRHVWGMSTPSKSHFEPTWDSLAHYETPSWFRDAKFGIWAHWGPQCVPEQGDWYARRMYQEGDSAYKFHCEHYGHPSIYGFKDVIHRWKVDRWDPEHLIDLYKKAGAKYFMALANHHDNFDNYNSRHHSWNSVALGPKKDIVGTWEPIVRAAGMRFGVSVHAAHSWSWYEVAQGADKNGVYKGIPYDGKLTKADGAGHWWQGLDPQDLYEQRHTPGSGLVWDWQKDQGSSIPDAAYCNNFYDRVIDLIDQYDPDMVYFDDTILPLYPISDVGLRIAAYYYNQNMKRRHGRLEAVLTGKGLNEQQRQCMVWDIERGYSHRIEPLPWQTDTCIGQWHYLRSCFTDHWYKKPETVVHMLVDIVSKNGNLMLNIPLPGHGEPDADELKFLADLTRWMDIHDHAIYASRPWRVFGEGPSTVDTGNGGGNFNEGRDKPFVAEDIRFIQKGGSLYAFLMAWPDDAKVTIKSLAQGASTGDGRIERVQLLGAHGPLSFTRDANGLTVNLPSKRPCDYAYALKIDGPGLTRTA